MEECFTLSSWLVLVEFKLTIRLKLTSCNLNSWEILIERICILFISWSIKIACPSHRSPLFANLCPVMENSDAKFDQEF